MSDERSLDDLAVGFFRGFARAEYALKAAGYHYGEGPATPNWDKFSAAIPDFIQQATSPELKEAVEYIFAQPPKKQIIKDGVLQWKAGGGSSQRTPQELFLHVRTMRNNLFHGGKFNGMWLEPDRSEQLLKHGLTVLEACVQVLPEVRDAYNDGK